MPATFPVLPFAPFPKLIDYEWPADEFLSASGRGISVTYWTSPRRHYALRFELLREDTLAAAPWNAYSEIAALNAAYAQTSGQLGTLQFTDPKGDVVTVRFVSYSSRKIAAGCWEADVELVEVR